MQTCGLQNRKDPMKITRKSHILAHGEFVQQAHLFFMQAFDFQNSKDSMEITQKSHLVAQAS